MRKFKRFIINTSTILSLVIMASLMYSLIGCASVKVDVTSEYSEYSRLLPTDYLLVKEGADTTYWKLNRQKKDYVRFDEWPKEDRARYKENVFSEPFLMIETVTRTYTTIKTPGVCLERREECYTNEYGNRICRDGACIRYSEGGELPQSTCKDGSSLLIWIGEGYKKIGTHVSCDTKATNALKRFVLTGEAE